MFAKQKYLPFFLCCIFSLCSIVAFGQQLQGKVIDKENGEALIGACIVIVNTENGNCTDVDGNFILENSPVPPFDIKVTYLGYDSLIYTVTNLSESIQLGLESNHFYTKTYG